jgi:hypothetical protein
VHGGRRKRLLDAPTESEDERMAAASVKQLFTTSASTINGSLGEQVAQLEDLSIPGKIDGAEFFRRNHFTDGLKLLVTRGFQRLAGNAEDGAFYLTQAMGGGKTHSLLAFGLLARDPELRRQVLPDLAAGSKFDDAKVVIFSGHQNPENLLWGAIADKVGRPEVMAPFWKNGARTPGVDEWVEVLGDGPVLILLDELPSYLQMAQGERVGNSTLGDLTIGALERLFNALPRCPRACVVVTNLKDDVYLDGSAQVRTLIESLSKHYDRNAQAITPVQQNTGEVFAIVRKRLFDQLPPPDKIDEVAQAYVGALERAKRVDTIATTPESFIERIRETYPFHPSIRDVVARFAENRGYQKTRALIRLLRHAVQGAYASKDNVFLIGLQHLDFSDPAMLEELRKINENYGNAIARDVSDRGNALAEKIDAVDGNGTASSIAKLLLMSSLSAAETPLRGLTEGELIENLVDPLLQVSEIKHALGRLQGQAWYMFRGVDQRDFFGQTANVTAEITSIAANIADEQVDQTLRVKLEEVFKPVTGTLYSDRMSILPAVDAIQLDDDRPTLVVLIAPADRLPADFQAWWDKLDRQNRVLVLTADPNAIKVLSAGARRMKAIEKVEERIKARHGADSPQMKELLQVREREAGPFTAALRETFKTIVFPVKNGLRRVEDFRMEFRESDYQGEQQIIDILAKRGKFIPSDKFDASFDNMRQDAEEFLFDADAMQMAALKRNAAARSSWYWYKRGDFEQLVKRAVQQGHWRDHGGLIQKKWERRTRVSARLDDFVPDPMATGRFQLIVTPEDADVIYVSEVGTPNPAKDKRLDGLMYETTAAAVWFLAVDSRGGATTGDACEWRAPIRVKPDVTRHSGGHKIALLATPRSAVIRASFDGSDPKLASPVSGEISAPDDASLLRVIAEVGGQFSPEEKAALGLHEGPGVPIKPIVPLKPDAAVVMTSKFVPKDTAAAFIGLDLLSKTPGAKVKGGSIEISSGRTQDEYLSLRLGKDVGIAASDLDAIVKTLVDKLGAPAPTVKLRLDGIAFASGRDMNAFCDGTGQDFGTVAWEQD